MLKDRLDAPLAAEKTVDPAEIARFTDVATEWWNPDGRFKPVHAFNPVRLAAIEGWIAETHGRDLTAERPFAGLRILDVGCGAGLIAEPLAARGATVVGIDASARNVEIAKWHAVESGLSIDYRHTLAGRLAFEGETFDVVLNLEVIEHVSDPAALMGDCAALVKPGGTLVVATLNRTVRAYLLAIVGAEYVLGWLPKGTHQWRRFLRPDEIADMLAVNGVDVAATVGVSYRPLARRWRLSGDTGVNYMMRARKAA